MDLVPAPFDAPAATQAGTAPDVALALKAIDWCEQQRKPDAVADSTWFALIRDLRAFARDWLDLAVACGWTLPELFGCPSPHSLSTRGAQCGLLPLLEGDTVVEMDDNRIVIETKGGGRQSFYKRSPGCSVPFDRSRATPLWEVIEAIQGGAGSDL